MTQRTPTPPGSLCAFRLVIVNLRHPVMMSKPLSPSGSPRVFRPVMLNLVASDTGPREHVAPHPMRIGEFYHKSHLVDPSHTLWEWVLLPL